MTEHEKMVWNKLGIWKTQSESYSRDAEILSTKSVYMLIHTCNFERWFRNFIPDS
jgi:hypothetical protein